MGNSHLQDIEEAYRNSPPDDYDALGDIKFVRLFDKKYEPVIQYSNGEILYNKNLEDDVLELAKDGQFGAIVTSILGAEHFIWSIQGQERPFDVILPFASELPRVPNAELVPFTALYSMVKETIGSYLQFNKRLADLASLPVFQLLPPLPVCSQDTILTSSPEPLKTMLLENGVPDPIIRYKMWRLWIYVAEEIAAEQGVGIIPTPEEAGDENGFLKLEYARDSVHANATLGMLTWREINTFFS